MKDYEIEITNISGNGGTISIDWQGTNGWGIYTIEIRDGKLVGLSECMDKGENKDFLKQVLAALVKQVEVVE